MQRDPRAFLWDTREAALAIQTFAAGMGAVAYVNNELVQAAGIFGVRRPFRDNLGRGVCPPRLCHHPYKPN
jgi:hypothetical protein